jgi:hypothetical protein
MSASYHKCLEILRLMNFDNTTVVVKYLNAYLSHISVDSSDFLQPDNLKNVVSYMPIFTSGKLIDKASWAILNQFIKKCRTIISANTKQDEQNKQDTQAKALMILLNTFPNKNGIWDVIKYIIIGYYDDAFTPNENRQALASMLTYNTVLPYINTFEEMVRMLSDASPQMIIHHCKDVDSLNKIFHNLPQCRAKALQRSVTPIAFFQQQLDRLDTWVTLSSPTKEKGSGSKRSVIYHTPTIHMTATYSAGKIPVEIMMQKNTLIKSLQSIIDILQAATLAAQGSAASDPMPVCATIPMRQTEEDKGGLIKDILREKSVAKALLLKKKRQSRRQ